MSDTTHLLLPYLTAAQAQKHVTVDELLRLLDAIVQLAVLDRHLAAPPGSAAEGARYIVASGATGLWAGWDLNIACWSDGAWLKLVPRPGWQAWVEDEALILVWNGSAWQQSSTLGPTTRIAQGLAGSAIDAVTAEELLSGLSGTAVVSTITVPDRAIVLGVSCRVVTAITGAPSFGCGVSGENTKFGGALGVSVGSSNVGVIGPTAYYAATPIRLTPTSGSFTGGAVRIAIHYLWPRAPTV